VTQTVLLGCPVCHHASPLPPSEVRLVVCEHGTRFCWQCASCREYVSKPSRPEQTILLVRAGVRSITVKTEPGGRGRPLTEDDLIEFGRRLEALPSAAARA
jgi:hypothetical protein